MEILHTPVLLDECLEYLSPIGESFKAHALMVDSTLGEGGHTFNFLKMYHNLSVIGLDADNMIQERAKERLKCYGERVRFFNGNFSEFYASAANCDGEKTVFGNESRFECADVLCGGKMLDSGFGIHPDIILFDLGISVFHYEKSGRGFSFRHDERLDMRLNPNSGKSAAELVNTMAEKKLADLIYLYGEEKFSRRIAKAIVAARGEGEITSSKALADIIWNCVPENYRHGHIHPATRTFQALRIAVNGELRRLPLAIHNAFNCLNAGGKMGVITFHSLEDRIVKDYFRNLGKRCVCPPERAVCSCGGNPCAEILTRKPVLPSEEEMRKNLPSRSAKLRVVRKLRDATEDRLLGVDVYEG